MSEKTKQTAKSERDSCELTERELQELLRRKEDYISGKAISRPWSEIKKRYENKLRD